MNLKEKFMKKIKKYNAVVMAKTFFVKVFSVIFCFRILNLSNTLKAIPVVISALKLRSPSSSQNPNVLIKKLSVLIIAETKIEK